MTKQQELAKLDQLIEQSQVHHKPYTKIVKPCLVGYGYTLDHVTYWAELQVDEAGCPIGYVKVDKS